MKLANKDELRRLSKILDIYNIEKSAFGVSDIESSVVTKVNKRVKHNVDDDHIDVNFTIHDDSDGHKTCDLTIIVYSKYHIPDTYLKTEICGYGKIYSCNDKHDRILQNLTYRHCYQTYRDNWYLFVNNYVEIPDRLFRVRRLENIHKPTSPLHKLMDLIKVR